MNELSERYIRVGNLRLHLRSWGKRGSPVVLLHGLASTNFVAPQLATHFRVYAPNQRGHGLSDKPATGYSFEQMSTDLEHLLSVLELEAILLVGHSWGADVALDFAARFPERVIGLCLIDGGMIDFQIHQSWTETENLLAPPRLEHVSPRELAARFFTYRHILV
jgi:pimeloyl-ACP methyl ester carboxylesterase